MPSRPAVRSFSLRCLLFSAIGLLVSIASLADETRTVAVEDTSWPPYYFEGDVEDVGFAREILERCLPAGGHDYRYVAYPIVRLFNHLRNGDIDIHVVSKNPNRETFLHFGSEPLFTSSYRPIVKAQTPLQVDTISDLDGLRLGVIRGLDYVDWFQEYLSERDREGTIEWAPNNESLVRMLLADRIDVIVNIASTTKWLAETLGGAGQIRVLDFNVKTSPYYVVVSKSSSTISNPAEYLKALDQCIRQLKDDPTYSELEAKYHID